MKSEFDVHEDLSKPDEKLQNRNLELAPRQAEIYQNLEAIGPEIAAFYFDGIRILQNNNLETAANLLAHITREIDGGLRNILSEDKKVELEFVVSMPDGNNATYEKGKEGSFKFESKAPGTFKVTYNRIGKHKASILQSLGINEPSPLAERWLEVTGKFHKFAHRRGAWETPRERETFVPLWNEFEDVLEDLVGNYLNLLIRVVDRILAYNAPTDEIRRVLPNLLKSETRREYFFKNLSSPSWLKPLKEGEWFDPESNISMRQSTFSTKNLDWFDWWKPLIDADWFNLESSSLTKARERSSKTDTISPWYALEYVERIAERTKDHPCDETISILVEIVDAIVSCSKDTTEKIIKDDTLSHRMIKIISALPEDRRTDKHITFAKSAISTWEDRNEDVRVHMRDGYRLIQSIEHNTNPALRKWLSSMSRADRINFLKKAPKFIDESVHLTEQGLANIYREYVVLILQRLMSYLSVHHNVFSPDQRSTLSGLLAGLHDKKKFDWKTLLGFTRELFSLEHFWTNEQINDFKYSNQILADIAELIAVGVDNNAYDFDLQLLPLAEQTLLVLVEKTGSRCVLQESPMDTFLNSSKGMVFRAMMGYTLCFARTDDNQQADFRWSQAIRANFTKRLDRNIEPSFEFSFMLGTYLPHLLYLDQEWIIDNVNRIFPQQDEHHWYVAFSMYLMASGKICKYLYFSLKEGGHYQKALKTNFDHRAVETALATHICTFWLEDYEELSDKTSLIYQVVNSSNVNYLSAIVDFCWDQRDNLSEEDKAKVRAAWRVLFKSLRQNNDTATYRLTLSALSRWIIFVDSIDEEILEWLKFSAKHTNFYFDIFVDALLIHAPKTPIEVGSVCLELSKRKGFGPFRTFPEQDKITETIRILYNVGHKEIADRISIQFAENGYDFLKPLYSEYRD